MQGRTVKWVGGLPSQNSEKIMQLLRLHELTAVNTLFAPRRGKEVHTFLQTVPQGGDAPGAGNADDDYGEYVGSYCKARYKGKHIMDG